MRLKRLIGDRKRKLNLEKNVTENILQFEYIIMCSKIKISYLEFTHLAFKKVKNSCKINLNIHINSNSVFCRDAYDSFKFMTSFKYIEDL